MITAIHGIANKQIPPIVTDSDALAFVTAAGITDPTQKTAINDLVVGLKAASIWSKFAAIYPMVGGSASSHKYNLIDPRDLDAAFRLTFAGGWTHSATGALPNGTTGYADSHFLPSAEFVDNDTCLTFYSRTNTFTGFTTDWGVGNGSTQFKFCVGTDFLTGTKFVSDDYTDAGRIFNESVDSLGLFSSSVDATVHTIYQNGVPVNTGSPGGSTGSYAYSLYLGAFNFTGTAALFAAHECSFASLGSSLSDAENATLYTLVQAYQTTLSRDV